MIVIVGNLLRTNSLIKYDSARREEEWRRMRNPTHHRCTYDQNDSFHVHIGGPEKGRLIIRMTIMLKRSICSQMACIQETRGIEDG
jgi:hypothetical protein